MPKRSAALAAVGSVAVPAPGLVTITDRQLNHVALTDAARALVMLADRQVSHVAVSDGQRALVNLGDKPVSRLTLTDRLL